MFPTLSLSKSYGKRTLDKSAESYIMCAEVLIMFKKFWAGALTALMLVGFGAFTEANQAEQEEQCCRGGYYCDSDCDTYDGDYCGRYGCRR